MISIFAKHTYLLDDDKGGVFLQRVSARIRGEEIAQYLGAKYNPAAGYENDICIYVKPPNLVRIKDGSYVDILDDIHAFECLKERPGIKVIAMSLFQYDYLKANLKNEIIFIPHHHVNFERILRDRQEITTCGYIGPPSGYSNRINNQVKEELAKIGLDFIPLHNYQTREDILNYYKKIDIQIIGYFRFHNTSPYRHPTKVINAASFGIPTITFPVLGYKEIKGYYLSAKDMDSLLKKAKKLKDKKHYDKWSNKVVKKAEEYHISKIAELYQQL